MFHVAYWAPGNTQKYANFDLERRGKVSSVQADITLDQAGSGIFGIQLGFWRRQGLNPIL